MIEEGKKMVVSHGMHTWSCSTELACPCYEKCMKTSLAGVNNLLAFYLLEKETLMRTACMQQTYTGPCMHVFFFRFY